MTSPVFDQAAFEGYDDDAGEGLATSKNGVDGDWTQAVDTNFRIRFLIQETAGGMGLNQQVQLQYNHLGAGWVNVNDTSSVVRSSDSIHFADGDDTTQQIGVGTFITPNGGMDDANGVAGESNEIDYAGNDEVEVEFCVQIRGADVADTDTIQLRTVLDAAVPNLVSTPTITVSESDTSATEFAATTGKGQQTPPAPLRGLGAENQQFFAMDPEALTQPEDPKLDHWWRPASQPHGSAWPRWTWVYSALPRIVLEPLISDWWQPASEPVRVTPPINVGPAFAFVEDFVAAAEEVTVDKWFVQASEPVRTVEPVNVGPSFVIDPEALTRAETVLPDKWWQPASEPTPPKPGLHPSQQQAFATDPQSLTEAETPKLEHWWRQPSEPIRVRQPLNVGPSFVKDPTTPPSTEVITVDKWFVQASEPVRVARPLVEAPAFVIDPLQLTQPEQTTLDRWWVQPSEPVRTAPEVNVGPSFVADPTTPVSAEEVTLDKWFVQASEPVREVPRAPDFPAFFIDPVSLTLVETVTLDKWFQPASEPVRQHPRATDFTGLYIDPNAFLEGSPEAEAATGGGYTPYAPIRISEEEIRKRRKKLRRDRARLRKSIERLLYPEEAPPEAPETAETPAETPAAAETAKPAPWLPQADLDAIAERRARLVEIERELEELAEQLALAEEEQRDNEVITVLLLASDF